MRSSRFVGIGAAALLCVLSWSIRISAQQNASSASVSRTREQAQQQTIVQPSGAARRGVSSAARRQPNRNYNNSTDSNLYDDGATADLVLPDVAVEEFVNYHKHRLPLPKVGQSVAMDVRWGNDRVSPKQPEAVLQIGFTTAEVNDRSDLPPVNLSLVIDKSGSMQAADKISRVKQALHTMIRQLRSDDIVSITVFDTDAAVLLPARLVGDAREIHRRIDSIQPEGSTNLNAGLQLGYQEALKNFDATATNRVILLTDGIANQGVTDPARIAANSIRYNESGVDLSTIGVGADLDNDLLRALAKSGRGLYHFVAENEDIEKVFVSEVQSLLAPIARDVRLTIDYAPDLDLQQIYGYEPRRRANGVEIPLDNMNSGLTAVVLLRFRARPEFERANVTARLSYYDIRQKRRVERAETATLGASGGGRGADDLLRDVEVKKNYTIAVLAQSLAEMTAAARAGEFGRAQRFVNAGVAAAYTNYPNAEDKDVRYVLNIAEDYQIKLRRFSRRE